MRLPTLGRRLAVGAAPLLLGVVPLATDAAERWMGVAVLSLGA